jgi:ABC-type lipoprotein export system ATPase subunit
LTTLVLLRNASLVVVTHDERILSFADRIVRLSDGRVAEAGPSRFELRL